jgi:uncharacterized protein YoxC
MSNSSTTNNTCQNDTERASRLRIVEDFIVIWLDSTNNEINEEWTNKYQKVKSVFTRIQSICDALKQDVHQSESSLTPISIVSTTSSTNINELDQSFSIHNSSKKFYWNFHMIRLQRRN